MMDIEKVIQNIAVLPENALNKLKSITEIIELPKGHLLFEENKIEKHIYFIRKGIVRAFHVDDNGNEITFWFGLEGDPVLSMRSYIESKPGYETIELLETSILYCFSTTDLQHLYNQDIHIANWGRRLAERELLRTEENFLSRQFKSATERYQELLEKSPHLLQRVQLGHIASYLGITQVSLSRIRSNIK